MNFFSILISISIIFVSCQSDQKMQNGFVSVYQVSLDAPDAKKELEDAKVQMEEELDEARETLKEEMKDARRQIEEEMGDDSDLGTAIGSFIEGVGQLASSMTNIGESLALGGLGISLGSNILQSIRFDAEFQEDGEILIGKKSKISFRSNDLHWKIKDGKMHLWNSGEEDESAADVFTMKKKSANEWDLIGEKVIFHLIRKD